MAQGRFESAQPIATPTLTGDTMARTNLPQQARCDWDSQHLDWFRLAMTDRRERREMWFTAPTMGVDATPHDTTRGAFASIAIELGQRQWSTTAGTA